MLFQCQGASQLLKSIVIFVFSRGRYMGYFKEKYKLSNWATIVEKVLQNFQKVACNISFKNSGSALLSWSSGNLCEINEEQSKRFHQDATSVEKCYQGRWNINVLIWCFKELKRKNIPSSKSEGPKHSFDDKKNNFDLDIRI